MVDDTSLNRLVELFPRFASMSRHELVKFAEKSNARIVEDAPREFIIRKGVATHEISCLLSGWAYRYTVLPDGRRQILAFKTPGDFVTVHCLCQTELPFSVQALTPTKRLVMDIKSIIDGVRTIPSVSHIFYAIGCHDLAVAEDALVGLGRRDATEKISRLVLKLYYKQRNVGLADDLAFEFPLRQNHIADATGLTTVHVNRILRQLRSAQILNVEKGMVEIRNLDELLSLADMAPDELDSYPVLPRGWEDINGIEATA